MRKAIQLQVVVRVRGEDEPAHDWSAFTRETVARILEQGGAAEGVEVEVVAVEEVEWSDEGDGDRISTVR